ncbi:hypothetical protein [Micromonospora coxensis]|uniref:hypothetical protein n=1 Tax=Micromonospora coxensis TaxID=356852 RepID=UPI0012FE68F7|nr:hypothetical protein [Micromonospora coxensis]
MLARRDQRGQLGGSASEPSRRRRPRALPLRHLYDGEIRHPAPRPLQSLVTHDGVDLELHRESADDNVRRGRTIGHRLIDDRNFAARFADQ